MLARGDVPQRNATVLPGAGGGVARGPQGSTSGAARVDDRATTNVKELSEEEKARNRAKAEAEARAEAAAAAASAASSKRSNKKKGGKGKW